MKNILIGLVLFLCTWHISAQKSTISIIPAPAELVETNGFFELKNKTSVSYNSPRAKTMAEVLVEKLTLPCGFTITNSYRKSADIQLILNEKAIEKIGNEGYTLKVDKSKIAISANTTLGLFYGIQTLLQLFPAEIESTHKQVATWKIPTVTITDYPRFKYRGMLLDVSRHFFSKTEVMRFIDEISRYKLNVFQWHLTDNNGWRIEIKTLPKLTAVGAWSVPRPGAYGYNRKPWQPNEPATYGGFYTQDEIKEVVQYAKMRGVTIIPEIDVPGHSQALLAAYPNLGCTNDSTIKVSIGGILAETDDDKRRKENSLNPSDENVYKTLDLIFTEVAALFPSEYIHVGGDECYTGFWEKDPNCKALMKKLNIRHAADLQGYFMHRVNDMVKAKGKRIIAWDDVLAGGIPNDATIMFWQDYKNDNDALKEAAKQGNNIIMSPTKNCYFDFYQGAITIEPTVYAKLRLKDAYQFQPVPAGVDENRILGGQANLWTENVMQFRHAEYMTFPRAWATAEVLWSPATQTNNWNQFTQKVEKHFVRADFADINCAKSMYDADLKFVKKDKRKFVELSTELPEITIYYTLDESMPNKHSPIYSQPIEIVEGAVTLRVITYRNGKSIGNLITLNPEILKSIFSK